MSKRLRSASVDEADKAFADLEATLKQYDEKREVVIKRSRDIQKNAKHAIYALQRNDMAKANELLLQCEEFAKQDLLEMVINDPELRYGSFANAMEEYAEGVLFRSYCESETSTTPMPITDFPIKITADEYLGGLMDCVGEVQRRAVLEATKGQLKQVQRAREFVDYVLGRIMLFELRNGNLRKKSDSIKWCLKRLEEVLFDLSVSGRFTGLQQPDAPEE
ncbi:hypothetical protein BASA81_000221 [Batrachochytrium salamandrivorans]|nr:hypothetical protein BASA81_000221 [Batrachochytrium salamandrivorans]